MKIRAAFGLALFCLVLAAIAVKADPQQTQGGCMMDAFTYCRAFIPDRERVAACLKSNHSRISAGCRSELKNFR
jgi:hypothetical protein